MKKLTPDDILLECLNGFKVCKERRDRKIVIKIINFLIEFGFVKENAGEFITTVSGRELLNLPTD
ncbi:hypothetical protein Arcpr_0783 [Archaeoglobus profundus DSM 5631]|uniref:Uncharacterized protein n=1 Tax=Archaeoglobus profundus (strain DSM 5631 / JCM 9629 / NBRC 100127 / Av18) TaxID=572546 RepID=D2RHS1_ARCPA|nr:hypothetical protein Arcpr_0783 [Archaeoglobus profundus DSM 5631]